MARNQAMENAAAPRYPETADLAAVNVTRPQRQCTTRSLAYKFVEQNSEDEDEV